jgi:CBS domain-containing protein
MKQHDIGSIPVVDDGKLIGIVTDRDVAVRAFSTKREVKRLTAADVMTSDVVFCHDSDEAKDAIQLMETNQIRRLPVLNEDEEVVGMVSLGDISHLTSPGIATEFVQSVTAHHVS